MYSLALYRQEAIWVRPLKQSNLGRATVKAILTTTTSVFNWGQHKCAFSWGANICMQLQIAIESIYWYFYLRNCRMVLYLFYFFNLFSKQKEIFDLFSSIHRSCLNWFYQPIYNTVVHAHKFQRSVLCLHLRIYSTFLITILVKRCFFLLSSACSAGYKVGDYPQYAHINSQAAEQTNSSLQRIKIQLSYMNENNFLWHCRYFPWARNFKKLGGNIFLWAVSHGKL